MSSSSIDNLDRPHEEAKNESEADSYDSIDDEFLRTAFNNRIDAPQTLGLARAKGIDATFIIGESGSGKSTLAGLLENSRLTAEFDGTCWLFSGDENSKAVIGNTPSCCTELPTRIESKKDKSVYYDFPGFFDNRDSKEIACSFYLKTLIDQTKTFRIILTVDYHMFQCGRSKALIDLVDYLQGLFPDIDLLLKALFVVVTKVPEVGTIEAIQAKVKEYVKHTKRLSPRISSILMWLADARQSARIELFRQPSKSGEIDGTTLQNIRAKLDNVSFIEKGAIELYVPKHTKYYVNKLVERLQNKMNIEILKMIQKIEEICQRKIYNSSVKELSDFITSVKGHILENYQENKNFGELLFRLCRYAEEINSVWSSPIEPLNLEALKRTIDSMVTLKEILPETEFNVTLWCHQFRALKDRISKIINFDYTEEKGVLKIKGIAIEAKKLEPLLKEGLESVEIYCVGAISFDKVNIRCKGVNISIIAPVWRVNGTNIIDVSGEEGLPFSQRGFNFDGHPGNPGGNAGNFLGICEKYVWDGELKIIANGGKGGCGEDGLDECKNLENMIKALRIKKPKAELKKPGPEPEPANPKPNEIESQPQNNKKRGGKGGCGGYGGNPGRVKISNETENILKIIIEKKRGEVGDNGSPGLKMERREDLPLPKNEGKDQKEPVPMYLTALQRCCGLINISDDPRPRQRSYSVRLTRGIDSVTQLSSSARLGDQGNSRRIASSPEEINTENLTEPSPNDFQFNEGIIKETHKGYFNKVVKEEGLQEIIEKNLFI